MRVFCAFAAILAMLGVCAQADAQSMMDPTGIMTSPIWLVGRSDVQKELKFEKEQGAKIKELKKEFDKKMQAVAGKGGNTQDMAAAMNAIGDLKKNKDEYSQKVLELLNPDQKTRLAQIGYQVTGPECMLDPEVQKAIGASDEQIEKLKHAASEANGELLKQMQKMRSAQRDFMKKHRANEEQTMLAFLSADQVTKYKELLGKPFPGADKLTG